MSGNRKHARALVLGAALASWLSAGAPAGLSLLAPDGGEKLEAGRTFVIRWNAAAGVAPVRLLLLREGKEVGEISGPIPAARGEYAWLAGRYRGGLAEAGPGYAVRVQTVDGALAVANQRPFAIGKQKRLHSVTLIPRIINAHRRSRWDNGHDQCLFHTQAEPAARPEEPPAWTARAGYRNSFRTWNECQLYEGHIFRAFLYFDLPAQVREGAPLQAELCGERIDDAPGGAAPWLLRLFAVTEPWSGPGTHRAPDFAVEMPGGCADLTGLVRSWLAGGWAAHGLLVCGPDETFAHDNEFRVALLRNIRLQVEYLAR